MADALDPAVLRRLRGELRGEVRADGAARACYASDASVYRAVPLGVVVPADAEDLRVAVQLAAEAGVPLLPRGGGTSLAGQGVGRALILDCAPHLRGLQIDPRRRLAEVEPGVVLDSLNQAAAAHGLMFGPDVAPSSRATLGGMIANNSCGAHSLAYGKTVDHTEALAVISPDGRQRRAGWCDPAAPPAAWRAEVEALRRLMAQVGDEVRRRLPPLLRRVAGYNLDELLPARWNLARLLVGSEGTLAVTAGATLRLVPRPERTAIAAVAFDDLFAGLEAVPRMLAHRPAAIELTDRTLLELARASPLYRPVAERVLEPGPTPAAVLAVVFHGSDEAELAARCRALAEELADAGLRCRTQVLADPARQADFWTLRKGGLGILMSRPGDRKPVGFVEDAAVAPERLADYLRGFDRIMRDEGVEVAYYAHASVGVIHARPVLDLKRAEDVARMGRIGARVAQLALAHGGSVSGEHGDGRARSRFLAGMLGPELTAALRRVKAIFDPRGVLNPGIIVDPPPITADLRLGASYRAVEPATELPWRPGGLARAIEHCNGNAACRQLTGRMCPTFQATRLERDSTRGRANVLREALSGGLAGGLDDPAVDEALGRCLGCKGCRVECPSGVDLGRMKSELLAHRYGRRGLPLRERLIAAAPALARWGWLAAPAWGLTRWRPLRAALERWLGLDAARPLPRPRLPLSWREPSTLGPRDGAVVHLLLDCWSDSFEHEPWLAARRLLVAAGYRVRPLQIGCCGRVGLSLGVPGIGRRLLALADALRAPLSGGGLVAGVEPSCLLTFRDELADALEEREPALAAACRERCLLVEELLCRRPPRFQPAAAPAPVWLHGHCHQRAADALAPSAELLTAAGFEPELSPPGCCGMAGAFGYRAERAALSRQVAASGPLPALAAAVGPALATGFSCRHQLAELAGVPLRHPLELLAARLEPDAEI